MGENKILENAHIMMKGGLVSGEILGGFRIDGGRVDADEDHLPCGESLDKTG